MLKKIIDKRNYIIFAIILILLVSILTLNIKKVKTKVKIYNYFKENIAVELYTNKNTDAVFKDIESIYKKYNKYYKNPDKNNNKEYKSKLL